MARYIQVLNLSRGPLRIGSKNIPPAKGNPDPTRLDIDDGKVRRDLARFNDQLIVVEGVSSSGSDVAGAEHTVQDICQPLGNDNTAGGLFKWQNTSGNPIMILDFVVQIDTDATDGAATFNAGTAGDGTTGSSNIIAGGSLAPTPPFVWPTYGDAFKIVPADGWITMSTASGSAAGLEGQVHVVYADAEVVA